jgi:hypothetical protein
MVRGVVVGALHVAALAVGGCAAGEPGGTGSSAGPVPVVTGDPGAADRAEPAPGATIAAPVVSAAEVPTGLTVAVAGVDADAVAAVREVLTGLGAQVGTVDLATEDPDGALVTAAEATPDLLVTVGTGALDAVDRLSASRLDLRVLVIGAQLPEPTANVTAVVWPGADGRWSDVDADAAGIDAPRIAQAVPAGIVTALAERGALVLALD